MGILKKWLRSDFLPSIKVLCLIASVTSCFVGGSLYVMGVWAAQLKQLMGFSQADINILTSALFSGGCIGTIPFNILFQFCHKRPWFSTLILTLCGTFGYGVLGLACYLQTLSTEGDQTHTSSLHVLTSWPFLTLTAILAGINVMSLFVLALQSSLSHLEVKHHQLFQMVMQAFYALGNITWPLIYQHLFPDSLSTLFFVITGVTLLNGVFCLIFMNPKNHEEEGEVLIGGEEKYINEEKSLDSTKTPSVMKHVRELMSIELILSCIVFLIAFALTVNMLTNAGSMVVSVELPSSPTDPSSSTSESSALLNDFTVVAIYGCAQMAGRLICILWSWKYRERPFALPVLGYLILLGLFSAASLKAETSSQINTYFLLCGVGYGIFWSSFSGVFMKISSIRSKDLGAISTSLSLGYFAPAIGPPVMNAISGIIYDHHGSTNGEDGELVCYGSQCYHSTFLISAVLSGIGLICALWLLWKDYQRK